MREATPGAKVRHAKKMLAFMEAAERGDIMRDVRASVARIREQAGAVFPPNVIPITKAREDSDEQ